MTTTGTYGAGTGTFTWRTDATLGGDSWVGLGSAVWTTPLDPNVNATYTVGGQTFQVTGNVTVTDDTSTGTYKFTEVSTGNATTYNGTDMRKTETVGGVETTRWTHFVQVPKSHFTPNGLAIFVTGDLQRPTGGGGGPGVGQFHVGISAVPEPSSLLLVGLGGVGLLCGHAVRWRRSKPRPS
jgi:hypothetical protein